MELKLKIILVVGLIYLVSLFYIYQSYSTESPFVTYDKPMNFSEILESSVNPAELIDVSPPGFQQSESESNPQDLAYKPPPSTCKTHETYYAPEEIKTVFKYKDYSPCKIPTNDSVLFKDNQFFIHCENSQYPEYAVDSLAKEKYAGSKKHVPTWTKTLPNLGNKQFVFIRCSKNAIFTYVFNRFNKKVSDAANEIRTALEGNKTAMSVLVLVFDSISRYSFKRNLPMTEKFLRDFEENEEFRKTFSVYEFDKAPVSAARTRLNLAQLLYGKSFEELSKVVGNRFNLLDKKPELYKDFQKHAIWSHFKSLGFVTMFTHNTVQDDITQFTGREILADHVFTNFWSYLWSIFDWHDIKEGQQCIGNRDSQEYSLDYAYQFFDNYPKNNKFAYVHINAAHEETGNVKTIDADLFKFLNDYLGLIKNKGENLAFFLMSDHGYKKINGAQWDTRSFFEFYTPFTYFIATKEVITTLKAHKNLKHNEVQLISRYDINLSLKHLAYVPYNISLNTWYPKEKLYYTYKNTVSLFESKVSTGRTCASFGITKEFCLCSWFEPTPNNPNEKIIQDEMIKLFSQFLNSYGNLNEKCMVLDNIKSISSSIFRLKTFESGLDTIYEIQIKTHNGSKIFLGFNFCLAKRIEKTKEIFKTKENPYSFFKIKDENYFLQLSNSTITEQCIESYCDC